MQELQPGLLHGRKTGAEDPHAGLESFLRMKEEE